MTVVRTAASYGAVATSRVRVLALSQAHGRVIGARVVETETAQEHDVRARVVVSATGVWTQKFQELVGKVAALKVQPSKGVHLVVPRALIDSSTALILRTAKSVLFVLPWGEHWIIGTTDTTWNLDVSRPAASATDVDYLLSMVNRVLLRPVTRADIESVYVGLRPLIADGRTATTDLSREHAIARPIPGLVVVSGGKYTTYRGIAADVVDAALDHGGLRAPASSTSRLALVGGSHFEEVRRNGSGLATTSGLSITAVDRLLTRYGDLVPEVLAEAEGDPGMLSSLSNAGWYLRAEIAYAVSHEGARHLDDVIERRTRLSMESRDRGAAAAIEVATIMASRLGWDATTASREVDAYRALVEAQIAGEGERDDEAAEMKVRAADPILDLP
jgi:glycerol-3-phosphate dehydrogenase